MTPIAIIACLVFVSGCLDSDHSATTVTNPAQMSQFVELRNADSWNRTFLDPGTDDWETEWFLDGETATVSNTEDGMIVSASQGTNDKGDSLVLWTKESFHGDIRIEYDYTRLDEMDKYVNILYIQATGIGNPPYVEDISTWVELRKPPVMSSYFRNMNLLHISYAAKRFDVDGEYVRARRYPASGNDNFQKDTEIPETFFDTKLFKPSVTYHVTAIKEGDQLYFHVEGDRKSRLFQWNTSTFQRITHGRVGLRHMQGRRARYGNFEVWVK